MTLLLIQVLAQQFSEEIAGKLLTSKKEQNQIYIASIATHKTAMCC